MRVLNVSFTHENRKAYWTWGWPVQVGLWHKQQQKVYLTRNHPSEYVSACRYGKWLAFWRSANSDDVLGGFQKFKKRSSLKVYELHREAGAVYQQNVNAHLENFRNKISRYSVRDIVSSDEFGFFSKRLQLEPSWYLGLPIRRARRIVSLFWHPVTLMDLRNPLSCLL